MSILQFFGLPDAFGAALLSGSGLLLVYALINLFDGADYIPVNLPKVEHKMTATLLGLGAFLAAMALHQPFLPKDVGPKISGQSEGPAPNDGQGGDPAEAPTRAEETATAARDAATRTDGCIVLGRIIDDPIPLQKNLCFVSTDGRHIASVVRVFGSGAEFDGGANGRFSCYSDVVCSFGWTGAPTFRVIRESNSSYMIGA